MVGRRRFPRTLARRLLRDLAKDRAVAAALTAILVVGVSLFVATAAMQRDLEQARDHYYEQYLIPHFTVRVKRAPVSAAAEVAALESVSGVRARVSVAALVHAPADDVRGGDPRAPSIPGQALSLPLEPGPVIGGARLLRGAWFRGDGRDQVIVDDAFARARGLALGDRLSVQLPDRLHELLVVGTATSPEFVYVIPPGAGIAPDPGRYAILYLAAPRLQESADLEGACNELVGRVVDARPARLDATLERIGRRLDPYGVIDETPIHRQASASVLRDELTQLGVSARVLPAIFLGVAALILSVSQSRRVEKERVSIGTLRAIGHGRGTMFVYYVALGAIGFAVAGALGVAAAWPLQTSLVAMYRAFFALPGVEARMHVDLAVAGVLLAMAFGALGSASAAWRASRLAPAEAMRPPAPLRGGPVWLERVTWLWRRLGSSSRLAARAALRRPLRSLIQVAAIALSAALIVATIALTDATDSLMDFEFRAVQHQDESVALRDPVDVAAARELAGATGGMLVEARLDLPMELRHGPAIRRTAVTALPRGAALVTPLDVDGRPIEIPPAGLVLSRKLAEILRVRPGDEVDLQVLLGRRESCSAPVLRTVETYLGLAAYADLAWISRLLGETAVANTLLVRHGEPRRPDALAAALAPRPGVIGTSERRQVLAAVQEQFGEMTRGMLSVLVAFSGLIALGAAITGAVVAVSERQRQIGTLRALGAGSLRVAAPFVKEGLLIGAIGTVVGLGAGVLLTRALAVVYDTEVYRFPAHVGADALLVTAAVMLVTLAIAQAIAAWFVARTDWRLALQVKE